MSSDRHAAPIQEAQGAGVVACAWNRERRAGPTTGDRNEAARAARLSPPKSGGPAWFLQTHQEVSAAIISLRHRP